MANLILDPGNIYLKEPRFRMNAAFRFLGRLIIYTSYTLTVALAVTFLLSDLKWLFWSGTLFLLFLADRLIHIGEAEHSLHNLQLYGNKGINLAHYLTPRSLEILEKTLDKALITSSSFYLLLAKTLIKERDIENALQKIDVLPNEFESKIDDLLSKSREVTSRVDSTKQEGPMTREDLIAKIEILGKEAMRLALQGDDKFIEARTLFSALIYVGDQEINRLFNLFSINPGDLDSVLIFARFRGVSGLFKTLPKTLGGFAYRQTRIRHRVMNRAWTARPTPTLDRYASDFTDLAREGRIGFLIGHEKEYNQLSDVLARPTKPNALLVGEPGSGKESIVAHLAFQITKDKVPEALFDKRLVALEIGILISGAAADEVSRRVNKVIEEIIQAGNIILYIPDIHNLVKTSGANYLSAADILIPVIIGDAFPVIGSTYPREFKQMIETQTDFASAFDEIRVEEIKEDEAIKLLTYDSIILQSQFKIIISFGAIKEAVKLAKKYFHEKLLPSSAEDLLKEAINYGIQKSEKVIRADDLIAVAERKSSIPIHRAGKEEAEMLLNLEKIIHERLIDQDEAVSAVSKALREYRSGLSRKGGPIAVFLFVGPTGVGKTELAKILTTIQFGSEKLMIRFDMSEYQDKQSIQKFIGSPDGRMAGNLTESVLQKPYSLILLDEFEKAHPDILNLFLQVFDDGRLTDSVGRTIDFTNTIIIATSNAHSDFIKSHIEAHTPFDIITTELKKKLTDYFRPELLNRFSGIIAFKTLALQDIAAVAKLQLQDLIDSISETSGIELSFDPAAIQKIAELGFDPVFGGRPLRGVISEKIRSVLAEKLLKGEIVKGSSIFVSLGAGGDFQFQSK